MADALANAGSIACALQQAPLHRIILDTQVAVQRSITEWLQRL